MTDDAHDHARELIDAGSPPRSCSLDLLRAAPVYVEIQAYRSTAFDDVELAIIKAHQESWQALLSKHGVRYGGVPLDGRADVCADLVFDAALPVDPVQHPAALPLVLEAIYDLTRELPSAEWEVHTVEHVVTRFQPSEEECTFLPERRLYAQSVKGSPAPGESGAIEEVKEAPPDVFDF